MKTSIIIPVYNAQEYTEQCLRSIAAHTTDYEVILIDNGSRPAYRYEELPKEIGNNGVIIRNKENKGFPIAVNLGVMAAKGEYICILNNDLVVTPGWLDNMLYYIESDLLDLVGPTTNSISGRQQVHLDYYSSAEEMNWTALNNYTKNFHQFRRLYRLVGFCLLMRKSTWDQVGEFDPVFSPGNFEDDDFCLRAIQNGFRLGYALDVYIHHFGSVTHGLLGINYNSLLATNSRIFWSKWDQDTVNELVQKNGG